ncbi:hypothetical protein SAMN05660453_1096 [Fructobacillus durionis]|uniref:Mub B2-like domain-containing protein n=1 Tax=Fructobacillus durionis TaxID=283737 RepID=A0A1I1GI61_9LACO|nr:hypothetical protein SAMN05660453_1096 [Fructobacillus durionis]
MSVAAFTFAGGVEMIQPPKVQGTDAEVTKTVANAPSANSYNSMIQAMHTKQSQLTNTSTNASANTTATTNTTAKANGQVGDNYGLIHPGNIPAGVPLSDFIKTYSRVIHYKDAENPNGPDIATSVTQPVTLVRWATYDYTTKKVVGWGQYSHCDASYNPDGYYADFPAQASPDLTSEGFTNPDQPTVAEQPIQDTRWINPLQPDEQVTVYYQHARRAVVPADHAETDKDVTRTINLVDGDDDNHSLGQTKQIVHLHRTAEYFDLVKNQVVYGDWTATSANKDWAAYTAPDKSGEGYVNPTDSVSEQAVTGTTSDDAKTLVYHHQKNEVNGQTPNLPKKYQDELSKKVTRTIHYENGEGQKIAPDVVQTVDFERTAVEDMVTHQLISMGNWGTTTGDTWASQASPAIAGYENPDKASVAAQQVKLDDSDQTVTVHYQKNAVQPKHHNGTNGGNATNGTNSNSNNANNGSKAANTAAGATANQSTSAKKPSRLLAALPSTGQKVVRSVWPAVTGAVAGLSYLFTKKRHDDK